MPTANPPPISETELNAYVDGECFPERQAIIEAWLARNPVEASRVRGWRRQNQGLRATFGRILSEQPPPALILASAPKAHGERTVHALVAIPPAAAKRASALWDRHDRMAAVAAGSFLAGAGVACLAGYWLG